MRATVQPLHQKELNPADPLGIAREFLSAFYKLNGGPTLRHQSGQFFQWDGACFLVADEAEIRADLYQFLDGSLKPGKRNGDPVPFNPSTTRVNQVMDALRAEANLPNRVTAPAWLDGNDELPADALISCRNGLLSRRDRELLDPTPHFWTHNALDFDFDYDPPDPKGWFDFLESIWGDDPKAIKALQEIFGYMLTADTKQQKIFMLVGPKRSGKGTTARVMTALLGKDNVCFPTLGSLSTQFGLATLIGKQAAIISDARVGGRADHHQIAEKLLSVSGEDSQTIDRKYLPPWSGRLSTRFVMMTNELPRLMDASGALASRFIVLPMTESFFGREDHGLAERLMGELPGILTWALDGLERLQLRGNFQQPESANEAIQELEDLSSPVGAFIRDRCVTGPLFEETTERMFEAWKKWCDDQGRTHPGNAASFGRDLRAAVPGLERMQKREAGKQVWTYQGIGLRE